MVGIDIKLNRYSKVYSENEIIKGKIVVQAKTDLKHDGIFVWMDGSVNLQLSSKTVGIFEAFYQSVKPIQLLAYQIELVKPGKLLAGDNEFEFEFPLRPRHNKILFETYHGVYISIHYSLRCEMKRSFLMGTSVTKSTEFILEYSEKLNKPNIPQLLEDLIKPASMKKTDFEMVAETGSKLGIFKAHGHFDSLVCPITQPFSGEIIIDKSEHKLKSIEIQLIRVETCGCAEGYAKEASEIQTIQIGDGDVCKGLPIPIFMIFPRLFSCPTLLTTNFRIEFEVNVIVTLVNDFYKSESFPIKITRF